MHRPEIRPAAGPVPADDRAGRAGDRCPVPKRWEGTRQRRDVLHRHNLRQQPQESPMGSFVSSRGFTPSFWRKSARYVSDFVDAKGLCQRVGVSSTRRSRRAAPGRTGRPPPSRRPGRAEVAARKQLCPVSLAVVIDLVRRKKAGREERPVCPVVGEPCRNDPYRRPPQVRRGSLLRRSTTRRSRRPVPGTGKRP